MTDQELSTLVPMSREDLRLRGCHNRRTEKLLQLHFVDGLGKDHILVRSEIDKFGLRDKYPEYINRNLGIRLINQLRMV